jgi:hypothetical protein
MIRREEERVTPSDAVADDADASGATLVRDEARSRGVDPVKGRTATRSQIHHDRSYARQLARPGKQIRTQSKKPFAGQPLALATQIVAQTEDVVDDDDTGPRSRALGMGQVAAKLAAIS